jgi:hypothetical protein
VKIGILGGGNVGGALGVAWARHDHQILFGVRDPLASDTRAALARCRPDTRAGTAGEAATFGDVVAIALPWQVAHDLIPTLDLAGKVVVDCTNPPADLSSGGAGMTSGAEVLAARAPHAKFVKAFNTTGANNLQDPVYPDGTLAMLYCGDDREALGTVAALVQQAGFDGYELGPLATARLLEAQAQIWIGLARRTGLGRDFGFRVVRR